MASIASFSGLASGIQWQDMIDQIMQMESARRVDPLNAQIALQQKRTDVWNSYRTVLGRLSDAARTLRDGSAFGSYKVTAGTGAGGRSLVTASASTSAAPGSYKVEVLGLAKSAKLSGDVVASATTALGMSGEFAVNGKKITVTATDTLTSLRDRINAANSGASASRVSASILSTGSGEFRLTLSSDVAGAAGIDLTDGSEGLLRGLGFVDGTLAANTTASGGTSTRAVSSVTSSIAASLGVTMPAPSMVRVGDRTIVVDLTQDSLSSIAAKIQAAGIPARTVADTVDGRTSYRLEVEGSVGTVPADGADTPEVAAQKAGGQRVLEVLGFLKGGQAPVSQVVSGEKPWQDGGVAATGASLLTGLEVGGAEAGLATGDTITIRGTDGAGGAVLRSFAVAAGSTIDDLLAEVNGAFAGGRAASASLADDGTIRLTDSQGGESKLAFSLSVSRGGTEAALLGRTSTSTAGRLREVAAGSDAVLRVDGVTVTRGGNTVSDVIAGVTLTLNGSEPGTEIDVSVSRDDGATVNAVKQLATAYNDVVNFVNAQTAMGSPLASNGTLPIHPRPAHQRPAHRRRRPHRRLGLWPLDPRRREPEQDGDAGGGSGGAHRGPVHELQRREGALRHGGRRQRRLDRLRRRRREEQAGKLRRGHHDGRRAPATGGRGLRRELRGQRRHRPPEGHRLGVRARASSSAWPPAPRRPRSSPR